MLPLQLVDSLLLDYHIGHVLLIGFVLTTLGALPLKSRRVTALIVMVFGLIFALAPAAIIPVPYLFLGLTLLVIGPMLYFTAK